ncbi:MAG: hypothetical protein FE78DRAFT_299754 [Acidomyces sp. 'richmondensis']|nr:MAG: hypothetical protein FE78DRAFT_299754 [Acidomyces sp. 'richmondensis']
MTNSPIQHHETSKVIGNTTTSRECIQIRANELVISRTTLIVTLTMCVFITCLSLVFIVALTYREYARQQEAKAARHWGRKSTYDRRVSIARQQIDQIYARQYSGCLVNEPENPFLKTNSPVEIMMEERVWEVPAIPTTETQGGGRSERKSRLSLWFDHGVGVWLPKK